MLGVPELLAGYLSNPWAVVFLLGLAPFSEARGAILYGMLIGLDPVKLFFVAVGANILVVPFIILLVSKTHATGMVLRFFGGGIRRQITESREKFRRNKELAVLVFVSTPVVGGVWTGAIMADALRLNRLHSFVFLSIGAIIATVLVLFGVKAIGFGGELLGFGSGLRIKA